MVASSNLLLLPLSQTGTSHVETQASKESDKHKIRIVLQGRTKMV